MTPEVVAHIEGYVRQEWSPEQIAGRLETTCGLELSPERIYQHIRADRQAGGRLYQHLRPSRKKRKKRYGKPDARGQIKNRVSMDQRPAIVEEKSRIGDWEIDLVMGAKGQGALVSLVERRSRYTLLGKVASKQADEVADKTVELLTPHKAHTETITADNGKEFAAHATLSQALDAAVYFAHPYHAWERGLNENTNGLIRQ
jgi:IS30 family transposase